MHQKPKPKIAVTVLVLLALLTTISASVLAATQQAATPKEKADTLLALLKKANSTVTEVFNQLETKNIEIPEASLIEYNQALALVEEARSFYEVGNYSQASNTIVKALQKLKETLSIIYDNTNLGQNESDIILEKTALLSSSINRYYDQLKQIQGLLEVAVAANLNTSSLEADIAALKSLLNNASNSLNQKDFEAVTSCIADAKILVERLTQSLNNWAAELKMPRLESYINQTETRLTDIKIEATSVSSAASITAINKAETSLSLAKEYLQKQLFNQTVAALVDAKECEEQAVNALTPTATASNSTGVPSPSSVSPSTTGRTAVPKP